MTTPKGYAYPKEPCMICGQLIAVNHYVRHLKTVHPLESKPAEENIPPEELKQMQRDADWHTVC